tara:strand:- start:799 stop:1572 length:774 start_codon:yes stop_codon:yes gene_type:complete
VRKKHPEHVNLERWLVSYADFITLLFAFFVIMYAISRADLEKFKSVSKSMNEAFGGYGSEKMIQIDSTSGGETINPLEPKIIPRTRMGLPAGKTNTMAESKNQFQDLKEKLEESISLEMGAVDSETPLVRYDRDGLIVRLSVNGLYSSGEVSLAADLRPLLDQIGQILLTTKHRIRIEGHSSLDEKIDSRFESHWEFSSARAGWVADYWIDRFGFNPAQLSVSGYGKTQPLTKKPGEFHQSANRRVEIVILEQIYEN